MAYEDVKLERVPRARDELLAICDDLWEAKDFETVRRIEDVVYDLMFRRSPAKRIARPRQDRIDRQKVLDVLATFAAQPLWSCRRIGRSHGIDGGRVSEIINKLRTPEDPTMSRLKK